jgi:BA14K-like protein
MKQSVFIYCAFAVVILGSVLFGLDWQPAALSPMPPIKVVAVVMPPPPAPPVKLAVPNAAPNPAPQAPAVLARPVTPSIVAPAQVIAPVANANPGNTASENANAPIAQTPPKPLCDIAACAAAYRSFRASDCTFNPSIGPRQLCTKGVVPKEAIAAPALPATLDAPPSIIQEERGAQTNAQPDTKPNIKCNVSACAAAYHTFTESDCTFMATGGQRKLCTK